MLKKLFLILVISNSCFAKDIIFDLYGVLFTIPFEKQIQQMGFLPLQYMLYDHKKPWTIKSLFLKILHDALPANSANKVALHINLEQQQIIQEFDLSGNNARVSGNLAMSPIMYLWQANKINYRQALKLLVDYISNYKFSSQTECEIITRALYIAFDLDTRKSLYRPISHGIDVLKRCAAEKDEAGNKQHRLFVLSNMDTEMIEHLKTAYPDIFNLFDGIIFSGETQTLKPDIEIYETLLARYNIKPDQAIFIDDQKENIDAAQKLGIQSMLCIKWDTVEAQLISLGVIKQKPVTLTGICTSRYFLGISSIALISGFLWKYYLSQNNPN
jgi:FMN phosphatase YigB (HAD superfamily)